MDTAFIKQLKEHIKRNLSNEKFGVSELAATIGMSRSNLLRRIQKEQNCSASQFIRNIRLEEAMLLIKEKDKTVSEISFLVGFGSTSYFIKCFREQYGYSPGEAGKQEHEEHIVVPKPLRKINTWWFAVSALLIVISILSYLYSQKQKATVLEKSIAVLPFVNDSNDSTNIYVVNGLMESILNNLQSLKNLKVVSRTSVEKFRKSKLSIPEIAEELNVNYIVEGSGQKIGNQIMLSVQLIQADKDKHLWAQQYNRELADIFQIQQEVAQKIASAVEIVIGPDEQNRLEQKPTDNMQAYDLFLKGVEQLNKETELGLNNGISLLRQAVQEDDKFARAYGVLSIAYYYQDLLMANKQFNDSLIYFADKALLYDPELPQALTGKALYYLRINNHQQAIDYLEKALEYNPNSAMVINTLSDIYTNHLPDTQKYLEYALRGIRLDINSYDSLTASYIYLHLSNALIQNGFVDEAIKSINSSLSYNPNNLFSEYVKAYVLYAKNKDLDQTKKMLVNALAKDSTRFDIMLEIGNVCYYQRNWEEAYTYFEKYLRIKEYLNLEMNSHKNLEIAYVYQKMDQFLKAEELIREYKTYADQDNSVYRHLLLASYEAYMNNQESAIEHLRIFAKEEHIQIWVPLFTPLDPLIDKLKDNAEFMDILVGIEKQFWENHQLLKNKLEQEELLENI
ncbi:helix-turn-helix domain-containing protein [Carboxylicivirga sp. M1479]|uniref:helix-turn-helix domain-containing protein n=1 Tax=Carboxylicivirga sp. M1479 TaxID=2594476 RepID=UPI001177D45D|nr:helix-turn-helix domain-containing protein [Carboxylicivirga sp. M1479]TRX71399.1 helix-turn-helix domain-containing protein [Carboxylicivirga sp. M1479]